jgi:polyhydroxyalkanoate synthesis regulator phasin
MSVLDIDLPDFSGHPSAPKMSFEQYQRWVCEEIVPELVRRGEMTREKLIEDFLRNEGRQTEEWPDFGAASEIARG